MGDTVSGLYSARVAFADHRTRTAKRDVYRGTSRIFRKEDLTAEIADTHLLTQLGGRIEHTRFRCIDIGIGTEDLENFRCLELPWQHPLDPQGCQQAINRLLHKLPPGSRDTGHPPVFPPQGNHAPADRSIGQATLIEAFFEYHHVRHAQFRN